MTIRTETPADYAAVELLTREAFWNVHVPGCDEHYLVRIMRSAPEFLPALALVAERDGQIVGNIMYSKSAVVGDDGRRTETLTFGPLSVLPAYQRQGIGKALMAESFRIAEALGYPAVLIAASTSASTPVTAAFPSPYWCGH
jgi:Predicted acetyltransferase